MSYYMLNSHKTNATAFHGETTSSLDEPNQKILGFLALSVSILFFGSNYLPVKQYETGDGMFFQLILTTGIWTGGFVAFAIKNFPTFYALPMLGGFLWVGSFE
jgi:hypothetical protein